jgi:hypothetical protein
LMYFTRWSVAFIFSFCTEFMKVDTNAGSGASPIMTPSPAHADQPRMLYRNLKAMRTMNFDT